MYEEANWEKAPDLTTAAKSLELEVDKCSLEYWIKAAAQGTWNGLVNGHKPEAEIPQYMLDETPLRHALLEEFAGRSVSETIATKALSYLIINAPDVPSMEFYVTQVVDEARHASVFRGHLYELGISPADLPAIIDRYAHDQVNKVLLPLEEWALKVMRDDADFVGGVIIVTVLVEGILAPSAELSHKKWKLINPAAAQIEHGANIDEIRHLIVGANIVKRHLQQNPGEKQRILDMIVEGRQLWHDLPTDEIIFKREELFQDGLSLVKDRIQGYELTEGLLLSESTSEQRLELANQMTMDMQDSRLRYMGLEEAII